MFSRDEQPFQTLSNFLVQKREVKLSADETSCVLHNCIPGSTYSVCLYIYGKNNKVVDRSRTIKVTTPAPIKPPVLLLK